MEKILVTKSSMPPYEEFTEAIREIWDSHWLTNMGKYHNELEKELKAFLKVNGLSLFTNGHMALELTLQAMNLSGEVITTPFTFASTTHAIIRNGLTPVFCDIRKDDFTIDAEKIEQLVTDRTSAILPVHVYGNICQVEKIERIARKYGLKVIYDAAHAFGVKYKGIGVGNFGDASMFSFHATKVFNTIEGGAVSFNNEELGEKLYRLKNFGIKNEETVDDVGANAKLNEFSAVMGLCNLKHVKGEIEKRKQIVNTYKDKLSDVEGIRFSAVQTDTEANYAYFPIVIDEKIFGATRNEVYDILQKNNIFSRKYFYPLTSTFDCYHGKFDVEKTPVALSVSKRILTLPLYADLDLADVERICDIIKNVKKM